MNHRRMKQEAAELLISPRGQYIMSQALHVAIKTLRAVPEQHRETSNIADMQFLLDHLFPLYAMVAESIDRNREFDQAEPNGTQRR